jgi:hypothetical protein
VTEVAHEEVDEFLRQAAFPLAKDAGFRRRGRELALPRPGGGWGVVLFHPGPSAEGPGFEFSYGMVGASRLAWWQDRGSARSPWPWPTMALFMVQAYTPDPLQHTGSPGSQPYRWALHPDGDDRLLHEQLRATLCNEVIPNLKAWCDPETLADALVEQHPNRTRLLHPLPRAVAMALLDGGPSARLTEALGELPEDDDVRQWMEARLASMPR